MEKLIEITDLKTPKGLEGFNNFLAQHSYVKGYQASKADVAVLELLSKAPSSDYPHIVRWYNHIKSFDAKDLSGEKKVPEFFKNESTKSAAAADDDDVDLFGSDEEEDAEEAKIREERLKAYAERKSKKPTIIAKSSIVIDVKPWGDETDLKKMEEAVRSIVQDGLVWGASKLVPVGYGIKKLQIMCVVEDEKVSVDAVVEQIQDFEEHVQSVDIAAFNKI